MPLRIRSSVLKALFIFPSLLTTSISYATLQTSDLDGDGMPDEWEMAYGLSTLNAFDAAEDFDSDGVSNLDEYLKGTSPHNSDSDFDTVPDADDLFPADPMQAYDTDSDGLPDLWEIRYSLDMQMEFDASSDKDGDTLTALQEYQLGTNPNKFDSDHDGLSDLDDAFPINSEYKFDSDNDGMPDAYEIANFFDPNFPNDVSEDFDGDSLTNLQEFELGSNPRNQDSDGDTSFDFEDPAPTNPLYMFDSDHDGLPDYWENTHGLNPYTFDRWDDLDADHLTNIQEYELGSDPQSHDSDGDGFSDADDRFPLVYGYAFDYDRDGIPDFYEDILGESSTRELDGAADSDDDQLSNSMEFLLGLNPLESDTDSDGVMDGEDLWPLDRTKALDGDFDGLPDSWEVVYDLDYAMPDNADWDADDDQLSNRQEYLLGTNPRDVDTDNDGAIDSEDAYPLDSRYRFDSDGDGLADKYEETHNLSLSSPDFIHEDWDSDGLTLLEEFYAGTDPHNSDSDRDYIPDGEDVAPTDPRYGRDDNENGIHDEWEWKYNIFSYSEPFPLIPGYANWETDEDLDYLSNYQEYILGTDPTDPDTDRDGELDGVDHYPLNAMYRKDSDRDAMPDNYETFHFGEYSDEWNNLTNGVEDSDGDRLNNSREFLLGTNPNEPDSDFDGLSDGDDLYPADRTKAADRDDDGLPDSWEIIYGLDYNRPNAPYEDYDADGFSDLNEYLAGTDPSDEDTDKDGIIDGEDLYPLDNRYHSDTDGDGLPDQYEIQHPILSPNYPDMVGYDVDEDGLALIDEFLAGTDFENPDTDGDGIADSNDIDPLNPAYREDQNNNNIPDEWEREFGIYDDHFPPFPSNFDRDLDGLSNLQEFLLGTDPTNPDTDGDAFSDSQDHYPKDSLYVRDSDRDAMPDAYEMFYFGDTFSTWTNITNGAEDNDGDGLNNSQEFLAGTNPTLPDTDFDGVMDGDDLFPTDRTKALDTDRDGLPDSWEVINRLDYNDAQDADMDMDWDYLTNLQEYLLGTDPWEADTDNDGVNDDLDFDPLNPEYSQDSDGDGLPDAYEARFSFLSVDYPDPTDDDYDDDGLTLLEEFLAGTDFMNPDTDGDTVWDGEDVAPLNPNYRFDSDGDGLPDEYEYENNLETSRPDAHEDADEDGLTNYEEYELGTEPRNSDSDGDGFWDGQEHFPLDSQYALDSDRDSMPDAYENRYGFSPWNTYDGGDDRDGDLLTNSQEFLAGTHPDHPDTDFDGAMDGDDLWPLDRTKALDTDKDGLPDAWEVVNRLDYMYPEDASYDMELDGLTNLQEFQLGTNPWQEDTDSDGVNDANDFAPLDPEYGLDSDSDGLPDAYELQFPMYLSVEYPDPVNDDWDTDGLSLLEEFGAGTHFMEPDTDGDGIPDGDDISPTNPFYTVDEDKDGIPDEYEYDHGLDPFRNDTHEDLDDDWLTNQEEYLLGSDPQNPDSDDDGFWDGQEHFPLDNQYALDSDRDLMPDAYENLYGLRYWITTDGGSDLDADMLNNSQEFLAGTRPDMADTDFDGVMDGEDLWPLDRTKALDTDKDGLPDAWEVVNRLDYMYPEDASYDMEQDGLTNLQEFQLGTNPWQEDTDSDGVNDTDDFDPLNPEYGLDSDGDGLPDAYELQFPMYLSVEFPEPVNDDWDSDGLSLLQEFQAGSDFMEPDTDGDGVLDGDDFDPTNPDYFDDMDGDGMPDYYELSNGLSAYMPDAYLDADDDWLNNLQEFKLGTDPQNPDSDEDGFWDGQEHFPLQPEYSYDMDRDGIPAEWEIANGGNDYETADALIDFDGNGLTNLEEFLISLEQPQDSDADGMTDSFELQHGLNPQDPLDASSDYDGDGLTALEEFNLGTQPDNIDSDGDQMGDGFEVANQFDPTADNGEALADEDGDGLSNLAEYLAGTEVRNPDTDGDLVPDGTDDFPLDTSESTDSDGDGIGNNTDLDDDGDRLSDVQELALGSDPLNADMDDDGFLDGLDSDMYNPDLPLVRNHNGANNNDRLGAAVVGLGDLNNDGYPDYALGVPGVYSPLAGRSGLIEVISGASGTPLYAIENSFGASDNYFTIGTLVTSAGDYNGDGYEDLLVGADGADYNGISSGTLFIHSGIDGTLLQSIHGETAGARLGYSAQTLGDVNGDNVPDYVAGTLDTSSGDNAVKALRIYSGNDGSVIAGYSFNATYNSIPPSVTALGDVNEDGVPDFAAGTRTSASTSKLLVFSGLNGAELFEVTTQNLLYLYNHQLTTAPDMNGDGISDILVGEYADSGAALNAGAAWVYSGKDGSPIRSYSLPITRGLLGYSVAAAGDIDGDAIPDVLVGSLGVTSYNTINHVYLLSGATGNLLADIPDPNGQLGYATQLAAIGDIDLDGQEDVLLGFFYGDTNGSAYVISLAGDNDNDLMPHAWELNYGLNPYDAGDADGDLDGDGFTNLEEYLNGTSPIDAADRVTLNTLLFSPAPVTAINFNEYPVVSYGWSQDKESDGTVAVMEDGNTLYIEGNRWQKVALDYDMTPNTVIEFDFRSDLQGEIQGVGFDTDNTISSNLTFSVYGTQNWGRRDYRYTQPGEYQRIVINAGQFYTLNASYFFFTGDDDSAKASVSYFKNVRVYESDQPTEPYFKVGSENSWEDIAITLYGDDRAAANLRERLDSTYALLPGEIIPQSALPQSIAIH